MQEQMLKQLGKIRNLPTIPEVITRLRRAVSDPRSDAARVARIIADDPSMMARILKLVNSVFYAGLEPVTSVQHAVARIGFNAVSNVALSTSIFSTFKSDPAGNFNREDFWRHSISAGAAMLVLHGQAIPVLTRRYPKDVLHLAGLVHDIGKIIFEQSFQEGFSAARQKAAQQQVPLASMERDLLGAEHAEVGAWLGGKWNLTPEIVNAIRWHHAPNLAPPEHAGIVLICHAANHLCNVEKLGNGGDAFPSLEPDAWTRLGIRTEELPAITERIRAEAAKSEILLSLA